MTTSTNRTNTREAAIGFAVSVLRKATDWQEAQHALADHPRYGPWIEQEGGDDTGALSLCQDIIRDAEERLGDDLPY